MVIFFPAVLFVWGAVSVLLAARRSMRDPRLPRSVGALRLLAGVVLLGAAVLSVAVFLGGEMQYGIVGYPMLAGLLALVAATPLLLLARRQESKAVLGPR